MISWLFGPSHAYIEQCLAISVHPRNFVQPICGRKCLHNTFSPVGRDVITWAFLAGQKSIEPMDQSELKLVGVVL